MFKLRRPRAFQLSHGLFTGCILIGWLQVTRWGRGIPPFHWETETQVPAACQPQPRQPHIIKLISQLQKPTRRITNTWIIDTGKRETRYQLVKVHQTIRQPHKCIQCPCKIPGLRHWKSWSLWHKLNFFYKKGEQFLLAPEVNQNACSVSIKTEHSYWKRDGFPPPRTKGTDWLSLYKAWSWWDFGDDRPSYT